MKSIITKISETELKTDDEGREYKTVTFEKINDDSLNHPILAFISVVGRVKRRKLRCYAQSFFDPDLPDIGFNEPIGSHYLGDIISKEVEPYDIVDKTSGEVTRVNRYSAVVFGDSTSEMFKLDINKAFEDAGHKLINKEDTNFTIAN